LTKRLKRRAKIGSGEKKDESGVPIGGGIRAGKMGGERKARGGEGIDKL